MSFGIDEPWFGALMSSGWEVADVFFSVTKNTGVFTIVIEFGRPGRSAPKLTVTYDGFGLPLEDE